MLRGSLDVILKEECKSPGMFEDDIRMLKAQIEVIDQERYHGALVRARARAFSSEKSYARRNAIVEIESEGVLYNGQVNIRKAFCSYYEKLFSRHDVDREKFKEEFMRFLSCLDKDYSEYLEMEITVDEVKPSIDELSPGKTPGPDGLSAAFYKKFKDDVGPVLCKVFTESYDHGTLPPSLLVSHMVLIPKS